MRNAATYTCVCLLQTCLAYILSRFGESVIDDLMGGSDDERMSTDRLLTLVSGSALFLYSIVLGVEYYKENFRKDEAEYRCIAKKRYSSDSSGSGPSGASDDLEATEEKEPYQAFAPLEMEDSFEDDDDDVAAPPSNKKSRSLAIIAFLGSLDDLALFVPMLVGNAFGIVELIIGAMISTLFIVIMCIFLTRCQLVANVLEKIPLAAIVGGFSVILLGKGIFYMD